MSPHSSAPTPTQPTTNQDQILREPKPKFGPLIPLHTLCQNCTDFLRTWPVLSDLQSPSSTTRTHPTHTYSPSHLSTLSTLLTTAPICHLCNILTASLTRRAYANILKFDVEARRSEDVYLHAHLSEEKGGGWAVGVIVGNEDMEKWRNGKFAYGFKLGVEDELPGKGFHGHVGVDSVPMYAQDHVWRAKDWIEECRGEHESCRHFHEQTVDDRRQRPTRVLEVSPHSVRLRCGMAHEVFEYLVLSHMWGDKNAGQLRLLKENVEEFQVDIPEARLGLTSTFREAIAATRALGHQYLWIDSLCIIQDSPSDWEFEARRMAIVYGNAVCNLAFLYPPATTNSTLIPRNPRSWIPCILRRPSPPQNLPAISLSLVTSSWKFEYLPSPTSIHIPWLVQHHWPLFHRAWTFQEYLLCPRTLLLGAQNLMYLCSLHFYDELVGLLPSKHMVSDTQPKKQFAKDRGKSRYFPDTLKHVGKATGPSVPAVLGFLIDWHGVLNEYRSRRLSRVEDRVVAFAGIARACSNMGGLTYLAGLWIEALPLCLLWCVQKKMDIILRTEFGLPTGTLPDDLWTDEKLEEVERPAPSWSWFAVPVYKYYEVGFLFGDDEIFLRAKSYAQPPMVCWDDVYWAEGEGVGWEDGTSEREGQANAFFDFSKSYIELTTYVLSVKVNWPADIHRQMASIRDTSTCYDDRDLLCDPEFEYFPDQPVGRVSPPRNAIYTVVGEVQVIRLGGTKTIQRRLAGLMLVPSEHPGAWRRVGVWKLRVNIIDVPVTKENMAVVAERWRNYAVLSSRWKLASLILI